MAERDLAKRDHEIEADEADLARCTAAAGTPRAPRKQRRGKDGPFAKVPLWWIALATKATRTPKALVIIELLYASRYARGAPFALPSGRLKRHGLSRMTIWRALQELKRANLITIEARGQKAPLISFSVAP